MSMAVLTLLALLFSPIIAVCITLWWQNRKEKRDAKRRLFMTLMMHRKFLTPTYDWVNALNLIDVVFADNSNVVTLWHDLYTLYQTPNTTPETLFANCSKRILTSFTIQQRTASSWKRSWKRKRNGYGFLKRPITFWLSHVHLRLLVSQTLLVHRLSPV
jgi:hypothetical protein